MIWEMPVLQLSDDNSYSSLDNMEVGSLVQCSRLSPQSKARNAAETDPGRQEGTLCVRNAQADDRGILCDVLQQRYSPQRQNPPTNAARLNPRDWLAAMLAPYTRAEEERLSGPVDRKTLRSQIKIWNENCSYCYIRGYWGSKDHKIADCRVQGVVQTLKTREALQKEMMSFRESGGTFCSGQCDFFLNIRLTLPDPNLGPECACEVAVLDNLSAMTGGRDYECLESDVKALKKRAPGGQGKDLNAWLCSTEEVEGKTSATATRVFAQLSSHSRRTADPEPLELSVNMERVRKHLAQQAEIDKQMWLEGKQPRALHRLLGQLQFWGGVPCPLCLTYEWHDSVYNHELRDCWLRKESASARKILQLLCTVEQPNWKRRDQCASCGYKRQICMWPQDPGFELDRDCNSVRAIKNGIAVLLTVHDGVLRKTIFPHLERAKTKQERAETRAWFEEEVTFWGSKANRLLEVFHRLADAYDGVTGKDNTRPVPGHSTTYSELANTTS